MFKIQWLRYNKIQQREHSSVVELLNQQQALQRDTTAAISKLSDL